MYAFTDELIHEHQTTLRAEADRGRRAATVHRARQLRMRAAIALTRARRAESHTS